MVKLSVDNPGKMGPSPIEVMNMLLHLTSVLVSNGNGLEGALKKLKRLFEVLCQFQHIFGHISISEINCH